MKLSGLSVTAFKGLADASYDLAPGFTIIRGPNEAGKSSFQQAILTGLFGDPTSLAAKYDLLHSWQAGRKCRIVLGLQAQGGEYELVRDFASGESLLISRPAGTVTSGRDPVKAALAQIAGLGSEPIYVTTACLRQQDLAALSAGADLRDMLQQTMTGGDDEADVSAALKQLDKEITQKFRKGRRGGEKGLWLAAQAELEASRDRQAEIHQQVASTVEARTTIATHGDEFEKKKQLLADRKALLNRVRDRRQKQEEAKEIEAKCEELQARIQEAEKLQAAIAQRETELGELPSVDAKAADHLKTRRSELASTQSQLDESEKQMAALADQARVLAQERDQAAAQAGKRPAATIGLISSLVVAALAAWQGLVGVTVAWAVFVLAVIAGIVSLVILLRAPRRIRRDLDARLSALEGQQALLEEQAERLRGTQARDQHAIDTALHQAGIAAVEDYLQVAEQRANLVAQNERDASRLSGVLGDTELKALQETLSRLNLDRMALKQLLADPQMLAAEMTPAEIRDREAAIADLEQDVARLDDELRNARAVLAQPRSDVEDEVRIDEHVAAAQQRVDRLAEYQEVLTLTTEVLEEARQQTMHRAIDAVGPTINDYLAVLTDGRYEQVQIDDGLAPVVYSREKSDFVRPEDELSLATKEQVYLACRLAFTSLLWETDGPPILLDDPLVNFDAARKARALALLRQIATGRQVVLFTCSEEYDAAADRVVVLEGPD